MAPGHLRPAFRHLVCINPASTGASHDLIAIPDHPAQCAISHFFHSNYFRLTTFRRRGYFGSDHFPVFIDLSYEPDAEAEQPRLQATHAERDEADKKVADAN